MFDLVFRGPPNQGEDEDLLLACEQHLQSVIEEVIQKAVAAGWNREDVLLRLVDVAWSMYEARNNRDAW